MKQHKGRASEGKSVPGRKLLDRRWVRSAALVAVVAAMGVASSVALVEPGDEAEQRGPTTSSARRPEPPSPRVSLRPPHQRIPASPGETRRRAREEQAQAAREDAARASQTASPDERVIALRDLERRDQAAATTTALRLVHDPVAFVRLNAVAVLTRSESPEAARVLASLDPESRRLAQALAERR